jgi:hypothetical protein
MLNQYFYTRIIIALCFFSLPYFCYPQSNENELSDTSQVSQEEPKKEYKRTSDVKLYVGLTISQIIESASEFDSENSAGFNLGIAYRKGRFFYWEVGALYNGSIVVFEQDGMLQNETLGIKLIEFPVNAGINLLSPARRVLGLRLYGGLSPGVIIGIGDNPFGLEKNDFNSFQFSGHLGVGVDVAFLFIETGYSRGFTDLLESNGSNLSQIYFNLGMRF